MSKTEYTIKPHPDCTNNNLRKDYSFFRKGFNSPIYDIRVYLNPFLGDLMKWNILKTIEYEGNVSCNPSRCSKKDCEIYRLYLLKLMEIKL